MRFSENLSINQVIFDAIIFVIMTKHIFSVEKNFAIGLQIPSFGRSNGYIGYDSFDPEHRPAGRQAAMERSD